MHLNESERFTPVLYNNLKGTIAKIEPEENGACFSTEIEKVITELDADDVGLVLLSSISVGKFIVKFFVCNDVDTDEDINMMKLSFLFKCSMRYLFIKCRG